MSIQAFMGPKLYSVERDIAHNFGWLARFTMFRMEHRPWDTVEQFLKDRGIDNDDMSDALQAWADFTMSAKDSTVPIMEAMQKAGWLAVKPEAQMALCAYLGNIMLGVYYTGIQEATLTNDDPTARFPNLKAGALETSRLLKRSPWYKLVLWAIQETFPFFFRKRPRA